MEAGDTLTLEIHISFTSEDPGTVPVALSEARLLWPPRAAGDLALPRPPASAAPLPAPGSVWPPCSAHRRGCVRAHADLVLLKNRAPCTRGGGRPASGQAGPPTP